MTSKKANTKRIYGKRILMFLFMLNSFIGCNSIQTVTDFLGFGEMVTIKGKIDCINNIKKFLTNESYIQLINVENSKYISTNSLGQEEIISDYPKIKVPIDGAFEYKATIVYNKKVYCFLIQKLDPSYKKKPVGISITENVVLFKVIRKGDSFEIESDYIIDTSPILQANSLVDNKDTELGKVSLNGNIVYNRKQNILACSFTHDNRGIIKLWDLSTKQEIYTISESAYSRTMCLNKAGDLLAYGNDSGIVSIWDIRRQTKIISPKMESGYINSVSFSPDSRYLSVGSGLGRRSGLIRCWDIATLKVVFSIRNYGVLSVGYSPDGNTIFYDTEAEYEEIGRIKYLSRSGEEKKDLTTIFTSARSLKSAFFDPSGEFIICCYDFGIAVYNVKNGKKEKEFYGHTGRVDAWSMSGDGSLLATGGEDKLVKIWDYKSGKELKTLYGYKSRIDGLCFLSNNSNLAIKDKDGVQIWDTNTSKEIYLLEARL